MHSAHDLQRFVEAQDAVWQKVIAELRAGQKRSHWMWFVFPQLRGLGESEIARRFAISSLEEARAYMDHAVLGERLRACAALVVEADRRHIDEIFDYPDDLKFRSCVTLFDFAAPAETVFRKAIEKYFDGNGDPATRRLLGLSDRPA